MKRRLLLVSAVTVALILPAAGASAYTTNGLLANYDRSDPTSFTPETMALVNTGSAGGSATKVGNVTFDETDQALVFPGTGFNKDYYNLGPGFANFGTGITIQANFNFGRIATKWERIFDFSNGAGSDNFLVGQYLTDGEIFVEVWDYNVRNGRCRSETGGTRSREMCSPSGLSPLMAPPVTSTKTVSSSKLRFQREAQSAHSQHQSPMVHRSLCCHATLLELSTASARAHGQETKIAKAS